MWLEQRTELEPAVMRALTESLDGSADTVTFDIRRVLKDSEYQRDAEKHMDAVGDDDWRGIMQERVGQSFSLGSFVRLYDEEGHTVYHVQVGRPDQLSLHVTSSYRRDRIYQSFDWRRLAEQIRSILRGRGTEQTGTRERTIRASRLPILDGQETSRSLIY